MKNLEIRTTDKFLEKQDNNILEDKYFKNEAAKYMFALTEVHGKVLYKGMLGKFNKN